MLQRTLLALALVLTAGASYAQTMQGSEPRDSDGRPYIGRNDWVRQPGDRPGPNTGMNYRNDANIASAPADTGMQVPKGGRLATGHAMGPEPMPADRGPRQTAFTDEYGFRYDNQGNRLDARGHVISPHNPTR